MVAKHGNMKKMAGKQLVMAVNALLLSLAGLATTFQCCGFLLSCTYNDAMPKAVGAN